MEIHIGLDLSFNSTGITVYIEDTSKNIRNIQFHRIIKSGGSKSINKLININTHLVHTNLYTLELDMKHQTDMYTNGIDYSNEQLHITEEYFVVVNKIMSILKSSISECIREYSVKVEDIKLYINMEGSILTGYNFNSQVGLNMLQGYLRAELIKLQLKNKFTVFKQRIIPPTLLKSFFTGNGKAEKSDMIQSFIDNYSGKDLIPQISISNKVVEITNDIIDSFATIAFNIYDIKMLEKDLFNIKSEPKNTKRTKSKTTTRKKIRSKMDMSKYLPEQNSTNTPYDIL